MNYLNEKPRNRRITKENILEFIVISFIASIITLLMIRIIFF